MPLVEWPLDECLFLLAVNIRSKRLCCREDPRGLVLLQNRLETVQIFLGERNSLLCLSKADIRSFAGGNLALPLLFQNSRLSWASFE